MSAEDSPVRDEAARQKLRQLFADHGRVWEQFCYVYPVISRRAHGLSIGVNVNPNKACNFDCIYCMVDRKQPAATDEVNLHQLRDELDQLLAMAATGEVWKHEPFCDVPADYQRVNDIAFSGDGEPTAYPQFLEAVMLAADLKRQHGLDDVKIVLITNATLLQRPRVQEALSLLDENNGEVWAKLDAGTEGYYDLVDRSNVPLDRVLRNIESCGKQRPIVIQSLFMKVHGQPVPHDEFDAYLDRLQELLWAGCRVRQVQLYTVARQTAEAYAEPLSETQLQELADRLQQRLPGLPVAIYP